MENTPAIRFLRLNPDKNSDIPLPRYMTPYSAGMDVCACLEESLVIKPGDIALIPTGFAVSIPEGFEIEIRPRSGLAVKHGIGIINSPGTIDSDYRGEIMIAIINHGKKDYTFVRGDRIAQMLVKRVYQARIEIAGSLDDTKRGKGGFGHTGV
ncbi:dUTP diphosphatase [Desulfobacterium sp. N47]|uniref:Deoxyuridine 5'-triphosphate nucleotidohydrolase n=1 Tax=uncultured Desulfobacterium sp. TaxID=201089 RepID=E1YEQ3_9BACT|nr:Deoxyuridine 5'-triphosphate nucleotidohydrolase [uncultured Desulfobacterium sp.]